MGGVTLITLLDHRDESSRRASVAAVSKRL